MKNINVDRSALITKIAEELKNDSNIKPPIWAVFVKTGVHKERPPVKKDWWYTRTAAVLLSVHKLGPIGVSKLRTKYGGKKNRGVRPEHTFVGSGNIIRKVLQQLEKSKLIKQTEIGVHKGRVITKEGMAVVNKCIKQMKQQNSTK